MLINWFICCGVAVCYKSWLLIGHTHKDVLTFVIGQKFEKKLRGVVVKEENKRQTVGLQNKPYDAILFFKFIVVSDF